MEFSPMMLLIVCPLALLAAFIDSAAGGGGLISLPAYYLAGLPPYLAAGTNKLSAGLGAVASTIKFFKEKKMNIPVALIAAAMAFPGSALGVLVQHMIPENYVRIMMVCVIPLVALVVLAAHVAARCANACKSEKPCDNETDSRFARRPSCLRPVAKGVRPDRQHGQAC